MRNIYLSLYSLFFYFVTSGLLHAGEPLNPALILYPSHFQGVQGYPYNNTYGLGSVYQHDISIETITGSTVSPAWVSSVTLTDQPISADKLYGWASGGKITPSWNYREALGLNYKDALIKNAAISNAANLPLTTFKPHSLPIEKDFPIRQPFKVEGLDQYRQALINNLILKNNGDINDYKFKENYFIKPDGTIGFKDSEEEEESLIPPEDLPQGSREMTVNTPGIIGGKNGPVPSYLAGSISKNNQSTYFNESDRSDVLNHECTRVSDTLRTLTLEKRKDSSIDLTDATNDVDEHCFEGAVALADDTANLDTKKYKVNIPSSLINTGVENMVGFLIVSIDGKSLSLCTAARINKSEIMTNKHCFYKRKKSHKLDSYDWLKEGKIKLHLLADITKPLTLNTTIYNKPEGRKNIYTSDDYVFLKIEETDLPETAPLIIRPPDIREKLVVAGINDDLNRDTWQEKIRWSKDHTCFVQATQRGCMIHGCNTGKNFSGAPVFAAAPVLKNNKAVAQLVGLHTFTGKDEETCGSMNNAKKSGNVSVHFNEDLVDKINGRSL